MGALPGCLGTALWPGRFATARLSRYSECGYCSRSWLDNRDEQRKGFPNRGYSQSMEGNLTSFLYEQRQRGCIPMQKVALANRPDFTVAKETGQAEGSEALLNHLGIVIRRSKHVLTAPIATAKTPAVNGGLAEASLGAGQKFVHVFSGRSG